jgi:hypothetical protein
MQQLFTRKDREQIIRMFGEKAPLIPATEPLKRMHTLLDCAETVYARKHQDRITEAANLADPDFKGDAYEKSVDQKPLTKQMLRIFHVVQDGGWYTLHEIHEKTGAPEASISAALRALTNQEWGRHVKMRERVPGKRLWRYRILVNKESLTYLGYIKAVEYGKIPA